MRKKRGDDRETPRAGPRGSRREQQAMSGQDIPENFGQGATVTWANNQSNWYFTLEEAAGDYLTAAEGLKIGAVIRTDGGKVYRRGEIERLTRSAGQD